MQLFLYQFTNELIPPTGYKEINLYWDYSVEDINYKHFIVDDTNQELGDLIIMSTKLPSKRDRQTLAKDAKKGKYGDCLFGHNTHQRSYKRSV